MRPNIGSLGCRSGVGDWGGETTFRFLIPLRSLYIPRETGFGVWGLPIWHWMTSLRRS